VNRRGISRRQRGGTATSVTSAPRRAPVAVVALTLLVASCGTPLTSWLAPTGRNHPLADRIWGVQAGSFVAPPELVDRLAAARFVLLGERHDNPAHHALQARLLRGMIAAGRRPAVGFEMLSTDDASAIARYLASSPKEASGLGEAVDWKRSGWPDWRLYEPIAQAALDAGLPIVATNLSRVAIEAIRRNGLAGLSGQLARQLGLELPLSPEMREAMRRELDESHCGTMDGVALERMVDIQWARDARMAEALVRGGQRDGRPIRGRAPLRLRLVHAPGRRRRPVLAAARVSARLSRVARTTALVLALAWIAIGARVDAEHEVYYRYTVLGFVKDAHGRPLAGTQLELVREKTGFSYVGETDAEGFYLIIARLGDESVGEPLSLRIERASAPLIARFDPSNHADERGTRVDVEGARFVERRASFASTLAAALGPPTR